VRREGFLHGLLEQEGAAADQDDVLDVVGSPMRLIMAATACFAMISTMGFMRAML
jgi:hypothetical protein